MRNVEVYCWKTETDKGRSYNKKVFSFNAKFHQFGVGYEEFEGGPGNYSTAIVELEDGSIQNVDVEMVEFKD
jgi:hypothetical protein